jgi:drug/metabolite transporter (DMT)-like permease
VILAGTLFGVAAAIAWGAGDFAGGLATRRSSVVAALVAGQFFGAILAGAIFLAAREPMPPSNALMLGALAGLSGAVGLGSFYRALRDAPMGIAGPVVAVIGAGVPAVVSALRGERLDGLRLVGIVVALVAVVTSSMPASPPQQLPGEPRSARRGALVPVVAAGLGFAGFFLLMDASLAAGAGLWWAVLLARLCALAAVVAVGLVIRATMRVPRSVLPIVLIAGIGDVGGNAFFALANAEGPLSVAAVLSSLYPVTTLLLARVILGERLTNVQLVGVSLALVGIVLIST